MSMFWDVNHMYAEELKLFNNKYYDYEITLYIVISVGTIHRCIDVSRYFSHDSYRDTVCKNCGTWYWYCLE